jgi:hypothetical protein
MRAVRMNESRNDEDLPGNETKMPQTHKSNKNSKLFTVKCGFLLLGFL